MVFVAVSKNVFTSKTERFGPILGLPPVGEDLAVCTGSQLSLPRFLVRVRVTELKYVVLQSVYQMIREPTRVELARLASSKQQAASD